MTLSKEVGVEILENKGRKGCEGETQQQKQTKWAITVPVVTGEEEARQATAPFPTTNQTWRPPCAHQLISNKPNQNIQNHLR